MTPLENLYVIYFTESLFCNVIRPCAALFNITQISEEEVLNIINYGIIDDCEKVLVLRGKSLEKLKYLTDKGD